MSIYSDLISNPPIIIIKKNPKQVIFTLISCMCDNIMYMDFNKKDKLFRVSARNQSLSNFQMKGDYKIDLEWSADYGNWKEVIKVINEGTCKVQSARSR